LRRAAVLTIALDLGVLPHRRPQRHAGVRRGPAPIAYVYVNGRMCATS